MKHRVLFLLGLTGCLFHPLTRATGFAEPAPRVSGWIYFDAPLWDMADDGLPFRLSLALPSRRDGLTRALFAAEARWTVSAGYAKVYDSFDATTGIFRNPGGHAALLSAGRQFRWRLPQLARPFMPDLVIEFGIHYATRRFPADGTRGNFKLITGLEWTWPDQRRKAEWIAGIVWPHFSNANLLNRNSGYDGLALRIGRSVRF